MRIERKRDETLVIYSSQRFEILKRLRKKAYEILAALNDFSVEAWVIGSVARGDVTEKSDIDVFVDFYVPSFKVKLALLTRNILKGRYARYYIVQSTPLSAPKILMKINERISISIPMTELSKNEQEFQIYAGRISLRDIENKVRVPGVNKSLLFIQPVEEGHIEWSIIGREHEVARILGISPATVRERVQMRTKRMKIGKSGLYIKEEVPLDKSPEDFALKIARRKRFLYEKIKDYLA